MWSLVVDELLGELNGNGYYAIGYSDDVAILINGKFPSTVSELLQLAVGLIQQCVIGQICPSMPLKW
jgi:hypothetical protein